MLSRLFLEADLCLLDNGLIILHLGLVENSELLRIRGYIREREMFHTRLHLGGLECLFRFDLDPPDNICRGPCGDEASLPAARIEIRHALFGGCERIKQAPGVMGCGQSKTAQGSAEHMFLAGHRRDHGDIDIAAKLRALASATISCWLLKMILMVLPGQSAHSRFQGDRRTGVRRR